MVAPTSRRFSGGSWDLRKEERRKVQAVIGFPDRRKGERRAFGFPDFEAQQGHRSGQTLTQTMSQTETTLFTQPSSFDSKFIEKR